MIRRFLRPFRAAPKITTDRRHPRHRTFLSVESLEKRELLTLSSTVDAFLSKVAPQLDPAIKNEQAPIPILNDTLGGLNGAALSDTFANVLKPNLVAKLGDVTPNFNDADISKTMDDALKAAGLFTGKNSEVHLNNPQTGDALDVTIHVGKVLGHTDSPNFGLGLPSLPFFTLQAQTQVSADLNFNVDLSFGLDAQSQPYVKPATIDLHADVQLKNPQLKGQVGFLEFTAAPTIDPNDPQHKQTLPTGFQGDLSIVIPADLNTPVPVPTLSGDANVNLTLTAEFSDPNIQASAPSVTTDFKLHWGFNSSEVAKSDSAFGSDLSVSFNDVRVNLGTYLSKMIGPVIEKVQQLVDPYKDFFKLLGDPIPVVSDVAKIVGKNDGISLLDIASLIGGSGYVPPDYATLITVAKEVVKVTNVIEKIQVQKGGQLDSASIDIGSFNVVGNQGNSTDLRDLKDAIDSGFGSAGNPDWSSLEKIANDLPLDDIEGKLTQALGGDDLAKALSHELTDALKNLKNGLLGGNGNFAGIDLEFPITDHPAQAIFGLLIGRDSDLVSFTADLQLHVPQTTLPLFNFEGLEIDLFAAMNVSGHLKIAYDTFGLREFVGDAIKGNGFKFQDFFDGFYLDPTTNLHMDATLGVSAGVNLALLEAKIAGHLNFTFDVKTDPNIKQTTPGKVRPNDFLNSDTLFDITGGVDAGLDVHLREGVDPLAFHQDFTLAKVTLGSFKLGFVNPFKPAPTVQLASYQAGSSGPLILNLGQRANLRNCQPLQKVASYLVTHADPLPGESGEAVYVTAFGFTQRYANVTAILADGRGDPKIPGSGDLGDVITIAPEVTSPVQLHGSDGDDTLNALGTGFAQLWGDGGDDKLTGGAGPCVIHGGTGDDVIKAGMGNALLLGGQGKNEIHGGAGTNHLFGGGGDNQLFGGTGQNFITGGTGKSHDVLVAGPLDDLLVGGAGSSIFYAGTGHDKLVGGLGDNQFIWHLADPTRQIAHNDGPADVTGGGGTNLVTVYGGPDASTFSVNKAVNDPNYPIKILAHIDTDPGAPIPLRLNRIDKIDLEAGRGENHVTVNELTGTRVQQVGVDLDDLLKDHFGIISKATDHIVVNGTPKADNVTIQAELKQIQVPDGTRNGGIQGGVTTFSGLPFYKVLVANVNDDVVFNGLGGDDTINVLGITGPTTIHGDGGNAPSPSDNDTFNVTVKSATDYPVPLNLDGDAGANALHVFEPIATPDAFTVTKDTIQSGLLPGVHFQANGGNFSKGVSLTTGAGGDTVQVLSTLPGAVTTINTGAGDDTVLVGAFGSTGNLNDIQGQLVVDTGAGDNMLVLNDSAATVSKQNVLVIPEHLFGFAGPAGNTPVTYQSTGGQGNLVLDGALNPALSDRFLVFDPTADLTLNTGAGAARTDVLGLTRPAVVNGGPAKNQVNAGFLFNSLQDLQAPLQVHGGGQDVVNVYDTQAGPNQQYTLTNGALFRAGAGAILFDGTLNQLNLFAGKQGDAVAIQDTPAAASVNVVGGAGKNMLTGPDLDTTWTITGPNSGWLGSNVHFLAFQDLTGGAGNDRFALRNGQGVTGTIDGGGGSENVLDYGDYKTPLTIDLGKQKATHIGGQFAGIQQFIGGAASDTLIGPDSPNFWSVTGPNNGTGDTMQFGNFSFDSIENLKGGASVDVFSVMPGGGLSGKVDGGGGSNTLDYSAYLDAVYVNLKTGKATALGGLANVDTVQGGASTNLLVGKGGSTLIGGLGRNILIAGKSSSTLIGGSDEDILIGGTTAYDGNDQALLAIMAEWGRTDRDYAGRVADLTTGHGVPLLSAMTVKSNGGGNVLLGNAGLDLFFGRMNQDSTDWDPATETFISL